MNLGHAVTCQNVFLIKLCNIYLMTCAHCCNYIFSISNMFFIFFYIHEFMSHFYSTKLWELRNVQILWFLFHWQLQHQPKFPSALALWVAPIQIPFVPSLFAPAGLPSTKGKHGLRASGSSGGLIIHDLSLWIMAHSPTAIIEIICSANPLNASAICHNNN